MNSKSDFTGMVVLVIFVNILLIPPPDHRAEAVEDSFLRLDSYPALLGPTLRSSRSSFSKDLQAIIQEWVAMLSSRGSS